MTESADSKKIITAEDPPEYIVRGITQVKLDERQNLDYSTALRFLFRHDPDVVFIGEIRDGLSAETALRASLTGHLVFATLHTDGVYEALLRLSDLGLSIKSVCAVLKAVIVQKLEYEEKDGEEKTVLKARVLEFTPDMAEKTEKLEGKCV